MAATLVCDLGPMNRVPGARRQASRADALRRNATREVTT